MKSCSASNVEDSTKTSQSRDRSGKKSTKSRIRKNEADSKSLVASVSSISGTLTNINAVTPPTMPTSGSVTYNFIDASFSGAGNSLETPSNSSKSHHKNYVGLEPRSVKIMWEQHDQTDLELSQEVCVRVAEDASYKLWELINNVKTYTRHCGGIVTNDLVNEVLKDVNVPPILGGIARGWESVDYDGSFFFHSDKILELRDEYQKEINFSLNDGPDLVCTCPLDNKHIEPLKQYVPNLIFASLYGCKKTQKYALLEAVSTPLMGACYRIIVSKLTQILAIKQQDALSQRCWRLLRACNTNPYTTNIHCRDEYFHLAEILVCQLLAPYETIKTNESELSTESRVIKLEHVDTAQQDLKFKKIGSPESKQVQEEGLEVFDGNIKNDIYKEVMLVEDVDDVELLTQFPMSPFFACPVGMTHVDELCETIGQLAAQSGYLLNECLYLMKRRLTRFFQGRDICSERDYSFLSRVVRGLIALGEYAFREFIPYIYKLKAVDIADTLWQNLTSAAIFLNGADDIFLYEWLEFGCGADKLQPFMVHYANCHEKHLIRACMFPNSNKYKISSIFGIRRLEWSTLAAAMCHGDEPSMGLRRKAGMQLAFPEVVVPNLQLNRPGTIRFKFAGCRPVLLKHKINSKRSLGAFLLPTNRRNDVVQSYIIIARRKLLKPITNLHSLVPVCSFYFTKIN